MPTLTQAQFAAIRARAEAAPANYVHNIDLGECWAIELLHREIARGPEVDMDAIGSAFHDRAALLAHAAAQDARIAELEARLREAADFWDEHHRADCAMCGTGRPSICRWGENPFRARAP